MELYLLVLFIVIVISFITGFILFIYNNIVLKNHIKKCNGNTNGTLNRTIRLDALNNFGFLLNTNNNKSVEINLEPVNHNNVSNNNPPIPIPVINENNVEQDLDIL